MRLTLAFPSSYRALFSLTRILQEHRLMFSLTTILGIFNQLSSIAVAGTSAWIVGLVATQAQTSDLSTPITILLALVFASALIAWLEMWLVHDMAYRVLSSLRVRLFRALERLAPAFFVDRRVGDVSSAAMADVETLEWFYAHTVGTFLIVICVSSSVLAVLAWLHPVLALCLIPLVLAQALIPSIFAHKAAQQGKQLRSDLSVINAETIEAVQGLRDLAIFDTKARLLDRLDQRSKKLIHSQIQHGMRDGTEHALTSLISGSGFLAILALAAYLVAEGSLQPQLFPVATILAGSAFMPVMALSRIAANLGNMAAAADRVQGILTAKPSVQDAPDTTEAAQLAPRLVFDRVSFTYPKSTSQTLKAIQFTCEPGETVALVGHSGAGKSTCAQLALRFWDVADGAIRIGDRDLRELPRKTINQHIMLLSQVTHLFDTTLFENIRMSKPDADDHEVIAAAKKANAHSFIQDMPNGYQTRPGDRGTQLSGGQRQRIALARAFLADPPILILDESMAHLDTENEMFLYQSLKQHRSAHQVTLVIAHRLSTIRACDRILVLQAGQLVETGEHQALLQRNGVYANLIQAQQTDQHQGKQP